MGSTLKINTIDVEVKNIEWSVNGVNEKIAAPNIDPYIIVLGYEPEIVKLTCEVDNATLSSLNGLTINELYPITLEGNNFPEFRGYTSWYLKNLQSNRSAGYTSERYSVSIELLNAYNDSTVPQLTIASIDVSPEPPYYTSTPLSFSATYGEIVPSIYYWDFDNGQTSNVAEPNGISYSGCDPGSYTVQHTVYKAGYNSKTLTTTLEIL